MADEFVGALARFLGSSRAALHEPWLTPMESERLVACVESGYVSSAGPWTDQFEEQLKGVTDSPNVVAVASGTAALHLALLAAGVRAGDEVLVPALSFVATANAVSYCGAIPHFVDVEPSSLGIDPEKLRDVIGGLEGGEKSDLLNPATGRRVSAIVAVHVFGHIGRIDELLAIADPCGLPLVEDAAEALGSWSQGRHAGTISGLGTLSFNGNKVATTGGGGAVLCADSETASYVRHLATTARIQHGPIFDHDAIGFNYRMPNLNAALGTAQLDRLPSLLQAKRDLAFRYAEFVEEFGWMTPLIEGFGCVSNYWLNSVVLSESSPATVGEIVEIASMAGLSLRPVWKPLSLIAPYRLAPRGNLSAAHDLGERVLCLPSGPQLLEQVVQIGISSENVS